jgi:hypothetical protein
MRDPTICPGVDRGITALIEQEAVVFEASRLVHSYDLARGINPWASVQSEAGTSSVV